MKKAHLNTALFASAALLAALPLFTLALYGQAPAAKPDQSYKYELVKTIPGQGYTAYVLDMVSQTWRSTNEVDRNIWRHWVTIIKPDQVAHTKSLLFITGGSNQNPAPASADRQ